MICGAKQSPIADSPGDHHPLLFCIGLTYAGDKIGCGDDARGILHQIESAVEA